MKPIETEFRKNGFHHKQLKRVGNVAIYERWADGHSKRHYEVVMIQFNGARSFPNGTTYPASEGYPSSEQWGTYGWTYATLQNAMVKLEGIA